MSRIESTGLIYRQEKDIQNEHNPKRHASHFMSKKRVKMQSSIRLRQNSNDKRAPKGYQVLGIHIQAVQCKQDKSQKKHQSSLIFCDVKTAGPFTDGTTCEKNQVLGGNQP